MIRISKDSEGISLVLSTLFFLAVLVSAYMLYSLPGTLMLPDTGYANMAGTYITIAITFLLGGLALYVAFKNKKELIVYKEKSAEDLKNEADAAEAQRETISLETVKGSIEGDKSEKDLFQGFMLALCNQLKAGQGALYTTKEQNGIKKITLSSGYALNIGESTTIVYDFGEGLIGQAAAEGLSLYVDDIPEGYIKIVSGLGSASPRFVLIVPIKDNDKVLGVIEIASFSNFKEEQRKFVEQAAELLAVKIRNENP